MEKSNNLPEMILRIDAVVKYLEQALGREDIPQDFQDGLPDICEELRGLIDHPSETQKGRI
jgi:hypothetical protein